MKNKLRIILVLLVILPLTLVTGCDDDFPDYNQEKEFDVDNFEGVKLGDTFQIEISHAEEFSVIAKGENRDLNDLQLEVVNGILVASYKPGSRNHKRTLILLSIPVLRSAEPYGTSSSKITGFNFCSESLKLKVSGASRVVTDSEREYLELQTEDPAKMVDKEEEEVLKLPIKKPSRLLGRVNIGEYNYTRGRWI